MSNELVRYVKSLCDGLKYITRVRGAESFNFTDDALDAWEQQEPNYEKSKFNLPQLFSAVLLQGKAPVPDMNTGFQIGRFGNRRRDGKKLSSDKVSSDEVFVPETTKNTVRLSARIQGKYYCFTIFKPRRFGNDELGEQNWAKRTLIWREALAKDGSNFARPILVAAMRSTPVADDDAPAENPLRPRPRPRPTNVDKLYEILKAKKCEVPDEIRATQFLLISEHPSIASEPMTIN